MGCAVNDCLYFANLFFFEVDFYFLRFIERAGVFFFFSDAC